MSRSQNQQPHRARSHQNQSPTSPGYTLPQERTEFGSSYRDDEMDSDANANTSGSGIGDEEVSKINIAAARRQKMFTESPPPPAAAAAAAASSGLAKPLIPSPILLPPSSTSNYPFLPFNNITSGTSNVAVSSLEAAAMTSAAASSSYQSQQFANHRNINEHRYQTPPRTQILRNLNVDIAELESRDFSAVKSPMITSAKAPNNKKNPFTPTAKDKRNVSYDFLKIIDDRKMRTQHVSSWYALEKANKNTCSGVSREKSSCFLGGYQVKGQNIWAPQCGVTTRVNKTDIASSSLSSASASSFAAPSSSLPASSASAAAASTSVSNPFFNVKESQKTVCEFNFHYVKYMLNGIRLHFQSSETNPRLTYSNVRSFIIDMLYYSSIATTESEWKNLVPMDMVILDDASLFIFAYTIGCFLFGMGPRVNEELLDASLSTESSIEEIRGAMDINEDEIIPSDKIDIIHSIFQTILEFPSPTAHPNLDSEHEFNKSEMFLVETYDLQVIEALDKYQKENKVSKSFSQMKDRYPHVYEEILSCYNKVSPTMITFISSSRAIVAKSAKLLVFNQANIRTTKDIRKNIVKNLFKIFFQKGKPELIEEQNEFQSVQKGGNANSANQDQAFQKNIKNISASSVPNASTLLKSIGRRRSADNSDDSQSYVSSASSSKMARLENSMAIQTSIQDFPNFEEEIKDEDLTISRSTRNDKWQCVSSDFTWKYYRIHLTHPSLEFTTNGPTEESYKLLQNYRVAAARALNQHVKDSNHSSSEEINYSRGYEELDTSMSSSRSQNSDIVKNNTHRRKLSDKQFPSYEDLIHFTVPFEVINK